ncbi:alpha-amylase family protein [Actinoplanes sp. NPDC049668]|uniref:alpha-amylase n=1 Tax=unclassified Actinoplanes TaxID=2626549 RepID=UPI0033A57536
MRTVAFRRTAAWIAAAAIGSAALTPVMDHSRAAAAPPGAKDVTATLFQWNFASIASACTTTLGPSGYGYVETSPPQEHIQGPQWWTSYQPVSYRVIGRLGDVNSFRSMVNTCHAAGVRVIVDAVINHMTMGSGVGSGGTAYTKYNYPGLYQDQDFHSCRANITNWADRNNVQQCELVGLADLNTGSDYVRSAIAGYLNSLIALGVDGFRIDAAELMAASDLAAVKSRLSNPGIFWVQEVAGGAGHVVQASEYLGTGDADIFQGAYDLKRIFTAERLAYLQNWGTAWGAGYLAGDRSRTFVDNWDTERNGSTLNYTWGSTYTLANVFLLAWPYGSPNVFSGYEFSSFDQGPPNAGVVNACYTQGWKCQHAWPEIAGMVGFRNAVRGTAVTNWWSNGNNAIAFGRANRGYVVINHEGAAITQTFGTGLAAGSYCDVQHRGTRYTVGSDGRFTATVAAGNALALYVGATC